MSEAARNGIIQQLNALAAADPTYAHSIARLWVENIVHWLITHGADEAKEAEYLQQLADTIMLAKGIAGGVG